MTNTQSKIKLLEELNSKLSTENAELRNKYAKLKQALEEHETRFMNLEQSDKEKTKNFKFYFDRHFFTITIEGHEQCGSPVMQIHKSQISFEVDDYNVWSSMDINEVNLSHLLCVKYPKDEKKEWKQLLEKLKKENSECRVIEKGRFEGVWVPLEIARKIALRYGIYDDVEFILEPEDIPLGQSTKNSRINNVPRVDDKSSRVNLRSDAIIDLLNSQELLLRGPNNLQSLF